jgi:hypothetical protein
MALDVSVRDGQFSGQVQHVMEGLRKLGCDKADKLHMLTIADLASVAITLNALRLLLTTFPAQLVADVSRMPVITKFLQDSASQDIAFKLSVNLLA